MSMAPITDEEYAQIEAYLDGSMAAKKRGEFERMLEKDERLQAAVDDIRAVLRALEGEPTREAMRQKVADWSATAPASKAIAVVRTPGASSTLRAMWWAAAAAAVILAVLGTWHFTRPSEGERLFARYFSPDPRVIYTLGPSLGAMPSSPSIEAMRAYQAAEYPTAVTKFKEALRLNPKDDTLDYFLANALLANGNTAEALLRFENLADKQTSVFAPMADWFAAMAILKEGDPAAAIPRLQAIATNPGHPMRATAAKVLEDLP